MPTQVSSQQVFPSSHKRKLVRPIIRSNDFAESLNLPILHVRRCPSYIVSPVCIFLYEVRAFPLINNRTQAQEHQPEIDQVKLEAPDVVPNRRWFVCPLNSMELEIVGKRGIENDQIPDYWHDDGRATAVEFPTPRKPPQLGQASRNGSKKSPTEISFMRSQPLSAVCPR